MSITTAQSSAPAGLSWLRRAVRDRASFVGIDVGVDRVRVATFAIRHDSSSNAQQAKYGWCSQTEFALPIDPSLPPQPNWVDLVEQSLRDRLPRCIDGERNVAVVSLPIPWIHYQATAEADISTSQSQCDAMFAASIFQSSAHVKQWKVAASREQVVLAATAESAACRIAEAISDVGYVVQGIMPHGVALLRAAPALTSLTPSAVLLLERSGGLVAMNADHGCGLCRNLPACDPQLGELVYVEQMEPWLHHIAEEVSATYRYVARLGSDPKQQSPVLICGSAAQVDGVDEAIANLLDRPVATWGYAGRSRPPSQANGSESHQMDSGLAVSLSLAYCGIQAGQRTGRHGR